MGNLTWWQTLALAAGTGLVSLVAWVVRQVLKGNLVPRAILEHERRINDLRRQENEHLVAAVHGIQDAQAQSLMVQQRMASVIEALWAGTGRHRGG